MIFQAPWAWLGLIAVAVPIVVHLLTRRRATRTPFPTLRFIPVPVSTAVRYRRVTDPALLAVRCAVLAAVVAALAQPWLSTSARAGVAASRIARAVVIDTSGSMNRTTSGGRAALAVARDSVAALAPAPAASVVVEADRLPHGIADATAWLDRTPGRPELIVASDFQAGALSPADLMRLPPDVNVRLLKIDVPAATTVAMPAVSLAGQVVEATVTVAGDRADVTWTSASPAAPVTPTVRVVAGDAERRDADAATAAALSIVPASSRPQADRPMAIVFPGAPAREELLTNASPIDQPWMFDVVEHVRRHPLVVEAERGGSVSFTVARAGSIDGNATLLLFAPTSDAVATGALIAAATDALGEGDPAAELEPAGIDAETLQQWSDPAARTGPPRDPATDVPPGASDSRWFWLLALFLLGIETLARRRPAPKPLPMEATHERVA